MSNKIKAIGVSLVAILAMSAMMAQAASAADFESGANLDTITATQIEGEHIFRVTGEEVKCSTANFDGEAFPEETVDRPADPFDGTFTTVTVTPEYTGCTAAGNSAKVTGFGHYGEEDTCDYVLHADGTADLECEEGAEVTIDAVTCTVHIPEQTDLTGVSYTNEHPNIVIHLNLHSITVNHTDGFLCPFEGSGEGAIGTLEGTATAEGDDALGNPVTLAYNATG